MWEPKYINIAYTPDRRFGDLWNWRTGYQSLDGHGSYWPIHDNNGDLPGLEMTNMTNGIIYYSFMMPLSNYNRSNTTLGPISNFSARIDILFSIAATRRNRRLRQRCNLRDGAGNGISQRYMFCGNILRNKFHRNAERNHCLGFVFSRMMHLISADHRNEWLATMKFELFGWSGLSMAWNSIKSSRNWIVCDL